MRKGGKESEAEPLGRYLVIEGEGHIPVSGVMVEAGDPSSLLVLGHGAGAPMTHPFMEALARALAAEGISTLRYNFAHMEMGRRRPDPVRRLLAVVASALTAGRDCAAGIPLLAGGKSMGGRMTSMLVAERMQRTPSGDPDGPGGPDIPHLPGAAGARIRDPVGGVAGLVFFGFPLHAPGRRGTERADHLARVSCPMLFHQGTRDRLADLELLRPLLEQLGSRAALHVIDGGDHSLGVLKRSGRTLDDVLAEVAGVTRRWIDRVVRRSCAAP